MKEYVRTILDYPVKGIQFRDITTLLQDAGHFKQVIDEMTNPWKNLEIDAVLSIESRGLGDVYKRQILIKSIAAKAVPPVASKSSIINKFL